MVGDKSRSEATAQIAELIRGTVKNAGAMLLAVGVAAALALGLAAAALFVATRAVRAAGAA